MTELYGNRVIVSVARAIGYFVQGDELDDFTIYFDYKMTAYCIWLKPADHGMQAGIHVGTAVKCLHNSLPVAYCTGLNELRKPGTDLCRAALFPNKLGTLRAVNVFRLVLECVEIQ